MKHINISKYIYGSGYSYTTTVFNGKFNENNLKEFVIDYFENAEEELMEADYKIEIYEDEDENEKNPLNTIWLSEIFA